MIITELLRITRDAEASDLHLTVGAPPTIRVNGLLSQLNYPALEDIEVNEMLYSVLSKEQIKKLEELKDIDFSLEILNVARFRANVFMHRRG